MIRRCRDEDEMEYEIDMAQGSSLRNFRSENSPDMNIESPSDFGVTSPTDTADIDTDDENLVMPSLTAMSIDDSPRRRNAGRSSKATTNLSNASSSRKRSARRK